MIKQFYCYILIPYIFFYMMTNLETQIYMPKKCNYSCFGAHTHTHTQTDWGYVKDISTVASWETPVWKCVDAVSLHQHTFIRSFPSPSLSLSSSHSSLPFLSACPSLAHCVWLSSPYISWWRERERVNECDSAVMYVPAKASEGQCRDRRCHIVTSLSVSATSWTLLLSPFVSHSISPPSFPVQCISLPFLCYVSTVTLPSHDKFENTIYMWNLCVFPCHFHKEEKLRNENLLFVPPLSCDTSQSTSGEQRDTAHWLQWAWVK